MTRLLKRLNFTDRCDISPGHIHIDVDRAESGQCRAVVRRLDLSDRGNHSEETWKRAKVFLEARRLTTGSFHRRELGHVGDFLGGDNLPMIVPLEEFPDEDNITFRVKVIDGRSVLLADRDHVKPGKQDDAERESPITLVPEDLDEELWKIDWSEGEGPRVLVNRNLRNCAGLLTQDPIVRGLVLPQIVRGVLLGIRRSEQESEKWVQQWLLFARQLGYDNPPDLEDDDGGEAFAEWVDKVVRSFAKTNRFASKAEEFSEKGVGE